MQYVLKVTPLEVNEQVMRVVAIDGAADIAHVLSLISISFDYANYSDKTLFFPCDSQAQRAIAIDCCDVDDNHYGPTGNEFAPFWQQCVNLSGLMLQQVDGNSMQSLDSVLEPIRQGERDSNPHALELRYKFVLVIHGVQHLVELMMASEKLNCFVPSTIMGMRVIVDDGDLSIAKINHCLEVYSEDDLSHSLNLKEATSRMRALGAFRGEQQVSDALVGAGATPLKFSQD